MKRKNSLQPSEHEEQVKVCQYLDLIKEPYFAIPNGGVRSIGLAVKLKKEGVKSGVPDLFLPRLKLFIEMKTKTGKLSANQKEWFKILERCKYKCVVAHGFEDAKGLIAYRIHEYHEGLLGVIINDIVNSDKNSPDFTGSIIYMEGIDNDDEELENDEDKGRTGYMENNYE